MSTIEPILPMKKFILSFLLTVLLINTANAFQKSERKIHNEISDSIKKPNIIIKVSYELDRKCDTLLVPQMISNKKGIYTFYFTVNREGQVQNVWINHHISPNIPTDELKAILIKTLKNTKFSAKLDAPVEQRGIITYTFEKMSKINN